VIDLHVTFVPDAVVCCCLLHSVLLGQDPADVARLLEILQWDGMIPSVDDDPILDPIHEVEPIQDFARADEKRTELGVCLGRRRNIEV
jgi:hypothetical protein